MNNSSLRLALTIFALAALTACGGGGGSSPSASGGEANGAAAGAVGSTGSGATTIVNANGSLQTSPSTSSYASGSMGQQVYDALNAARLASGAGALNQSRALDVAADAHATYLTTLEAMTLTNAQMTELAAAPGSLHQELADVLPGAYYASMPLDRAIKSGAITSVGYASEGIAGGFKVVNNQFAVDGTSCVSGLLNSVYHADVALASWTSVAVGQFIDGLGEPGCVVDYSRADAFGQVRKAGTLVVNPADGATVNGTFLIANESPRPAPTLLLAATAGSPVLVSMANADFINAGADASPTVVKFELRKGDGSLVDAVVLAATGMTGSSITAIDAQLLAGTAVLVPKAALAAGVHSVSFAGTIKGVAVTKAWSFVAQ